MPKRVIDTGKVLRRKLEAVAKKLRMPIRKVAHYRLSCGCGLCRTIHQALYGVPLPPIGIEPERRTWDNGGMEFRLSPGFNTIRSNYIISRG